MKKSELERAQYSFLQACRDNDLEQVKTLVSLSQIKKIVQDGLLRALLFHADNVFDLLLPMLQKGQERSLLKAAIHQKNLSAFLKILPLSSPKDHNTYLAFACTHGYLETVKHFILTAEPDHPDCLALIKAVQQGNVEIVQYLLPYCDPKANDSGALYWAAEKGHHQLVRLLLPLSDAKVLNSRCLRAASAREKADLVTLLWDYSDPKDALEKMKFDGADPSSYRLIKERLTIEENKKELGGSVEHFKNKKPLSHKKSKM